MTVTKSKNQKVNRTLKFFAGQTICFASLAVFAVNCQNTDLNEKNQTATRQPALSAGKETLRDNMSNVDKIVYNSPLAANVAATITLKSTAFEPNAAIPDRHSAYYDDISPRLSWSNMPPETKSIVLIVEDPDAPKPEPFVHWLVMNLPPDATDLPENQPHTENLAAPYDNAQQGGNGFGGVGYLGPKPPPGHGRHHYHFQIFALDIARIDLLADYSLTELAGEMTNHILAKGELVGTYERRADQ